MMSLKSDPQPQKNLKQLLDTISEEHLRIKIDEPLFYAASMFSIPDKCPINQFQLIEVAGAFVQHLYEHGVLLPQTLSADQARAEALYLIETAYKGTTGTGLGVALTDAQNQFYNGLAVVLNGLMDSIRQRQRQIYMRGMHQMLIDPSDWLSRTHITKEIYEVLPTSESPGLERCSVSQMTGECIDLIILHRETDRILAEMVRPQGPNTNH